MNDETSWIQASGNKKNVDPRNVKGVDCFFTFILVRRQEEHIQATHAPRTREKRLVRSVLCVQTPVWAVDVVRLHDAHGVITSALLIVVSFTVVGAVIRGAVLVEVGRVRAPASVHQRDNTYVHDVDCCQVGLR